ncbi:hypothetical protein INT43_002214 [Umbelopsis isabellina]|uniref:Chromatin modification-related protein EAF3 n=1 Tax=Mortierella isabellina TaxID=91625 RepID=A0A8H7Q4G9_MORIS|nr:hypothetical protein INT43_002214 [Umbelopsis isabellina]
MPREASTFSDDERVLCYHGPMLYEAKVLKGANMDEEEMQGPHYFVHYKGWKQTWDEWVPEDRVLKWTETNLQKQAQLKEAHYRKKPARSAASSTPTTEKGHDGESRGRKRARDSSLDKAKEEEAMSKTDIKIDIPEQLKGLLVDDWENVTKTQKLLSLPRKPTVSEILDDYIDRSMKANKRHGSESEEVLNEVVRGIKVYFDKTIGNMLLYRLERKQFAKTVEAHPETSPSDIYGAEHLLRLFVQFPRLITASNVDPDSALILKDYLQDVLIFLQQEQSRLFDA